MIGQSKGDFLLLRFRFAGDKDFDEISNVIMSQNDSFFPTFPPGQRPTRQRPFLTAPDTVPPSASQKIHVTDFTDILRLCY